MTVAYDGGNYYGWQIQPRHNTVQAECEKALAQISGAHSRVQCSGRTDTGVHARGQVAHFDLCRSLEPRALSNGLNALLPPDIRVLKLTPTASDFHACFSAVGKEYRYFICNAPHVFPDERMYRLHERKPLNVDAMQAAARLIQGRHDFASFSANPKRDMKGTVRNLYELKVLKRGRTIIIVAHGEGFLYKMVRSLAGFLVRVGREEVPPSLANEILASGVRTARVPTAQPYGLFLWKVFY